MIDEKETTIGNGELFLDGSSGGASFGDGSSAVGLRMYKRMKRRKMGNSDEMRKSEFDDKIKAADGSAADQDKRMLSFDAITNGPGERSLRQCSNSVLQQTHQALNGHENGLGGCILNTFVTYQEGGCMSVIKESLDNVERSDNQTVASTPELSRVKSCGLLKQSKGSTSSELCQRALSDILNSDKFSELRGLFKKFGVNDINRVLGIDAISLKIENGAYETSPTLYLKDIKQVWTKLEQAGQEMVTLAQSLSDKSGSHYKQDIRTNSQIQTPTSFSFSPFSQQFVRKPWASEPRRCQGCGRKAEARDCLICDSCEDMYHLSCTGLVGTQIPPLKWYCARCVSNGLGSPHDNCVVCEKLKGATDENPPNGSEQHLHCVTDENQSSHICFICKLEVKSRDRSRTCAHSSCPHKFYHYKCLTNKQLGLWGPCWYCPSCLCRHCLVDKDDDQIVLCDSCDEAYHMYCAIPQLYSIPKGSWFCGKCDRQLKRLRTMKRMYENIQKKVKLEDGSEKVEHEEDGSDSENEREGLNILISAAISQRLSDMRHESVGYS